MEKPKEKKVIKKSEIVDQIKIWKEWIKRKQKTTDKIYLCKDKKIVEKLAEGVLHNEKNHELKFCPCRMTLGNKSEDLKIVCPCNFKIQKTWMENGRCWCGLFKRKEQ